MEGKINGKYTVNIRSSKTVKLITVLFVILTVSLSGCVEDEQNNTIGEEYTYGMANVESISILTLESFPVQINVIAEGYLPDGCTEIDEIKTERDGNTFNISITTKRPKDAICTQAIENFTTEPISLEVRDLSAGNYTVNVNGVTGSFEFAVDNTLHGLPDDITLEQTLEQQKITEADNGTTISLEKGEILYLRLQENLTTGYSWELNLSQGLILVSDKYEPPESEKGEQPLVGAGGVHIWEIKANSEGTQQITAVYRRSWENVTGKEDRFTLDVEVV